MENICKLIAAALLLAGCATTQPNSPAACVFDKLAELPLAGSALRPTLKMAIDGKQVNLLLDTGATATLITRTAFERLDLGPGDYQFKRSLANTGQWVTHGFVGLPSPSSLVREAAYGVRAAAEALPLGRVSALPGKAMRRLDVLRGLA